jgi:hypothetical protein
MSGGERRVLEEDGMCLQGIAQRDESKLFASIERAGRLEKEGGRWMSLTMS